MKTFDDFKKEIRDRARGYANDMNEFYECDVGIIPSSGHAGNLLFVEMTFTPDAGDREKISYVYDTESECFVAARVTKTAIKQNKRQPKTPVTLDNYEFAGKSMGIKGIHSKGRGWRKFSNSGGTSESMGTIFRGQHFTDEEFERTQKLCAEGMAFEDAAAKAKAA